jgi:hypothetical protein
MFDAVLVNVSGPMRDDLVREFLDAGRAKGEAPVSQG